MEAETKANLEISRVNEDSSQKMGSLSAEAASRVSSANEARAVAEGAAAVAIDDARAAREGR